MKYLKSIFTKTTFQSSTPADLSILNTDIHSHLIPGIDDGAQTIKDSIDIIKKFQELGYKKLITTPHIASDYFKNTPEIILPKLKKVQEELRKQNIKIELEAIAEYKIDEGFIEKVKNQEPLLSTKNKYLLVEFSFVGILKNYFSLLFELQSQGYKIILAHPERYEFWNEKNNDFKKLINQGVMLQLNLLSLFGHYGAKVKKTAEFLIKQNMISFLGSDCHKINHFKILEAHLNNKYLKLLLKNNTLLNHTL